MNELLTYEESVALAIHSINANDLYTALKICKSADSVEHPDQRLNFMHAAILNQLGLYKDSIALYEQVLIGDSANELARFHLGSACFFAGDIDKARVEWDEEGYFSKAVKGFFFAHDDHIEDAIDSFLQFTQSNSKYPELNPDLERLAQMLQDKLDKSQISVDDSEVAAETKVEVTPAETMDDSTVDALLSIYKKN